ncbi:sensor histidine kinase [uncultured Maribacter sp.]|uniref:tetratricopeptide repeat-containing sensor histidine kinase n=1 Tax=uncultured Maribacter sp. TaxID=431308 RepID=UPI002637A74D|nr:sensor histidine kinase [uncultured Maribacter sp.]
MSLIFQLKNIFFYMVLFPILALGQDTSIDTTNNNDKKIYFGWSKRTNSKSLKPYFQQLKNTEYGVQRFSVFEQLIIHHTQKSNTDSILHYSNLYLKEIGNWEETEHVKRRHYAKVHFYLGTGSFMNGLIDNAIKWHIKGLQDAENSNYTEYRYKNKLGLAKCYIHQSKNDKAITILNKSLDEFSPEFPSLKIKNNILLGKAYRFQKEYNKAHLFYKDALKIADSLNDIEMQLTSKLELAKLNEAQQKLEPAFQGYESTRNEAKKNGFDAIYFEGSLLLAKYYYSQEYHELALIGLSMAYINAIDSENLQFQREALILQAENFAKQKDYKNSYAIMTQLFGVLNKIKSSQQREIIKELEIQYETLEKEKEISKLEEDQIIKEAELKRQKTIKNAFLIGFLIILVPVIGLLYMYYQKLQTQSELAKKQKEINEQKVTSLKQEQELNLIKASIAGQDEERKRIAQELHDSIGGNLAGIKLQISSIPDSKSKLKNISQQLDDTYQLVRDISHTLVPKKYKQNNFTGLIKEYLNNIKKTGQLNVAFHPHGVEELNGINDNIQMELFKIIQELMTNTLKHAKAEKVDIHLNFVEKEISLMFEDNGVGFDSKIANDGIGFKNIKNRVSQLEGQIHIDSLKNRGTIISIDIPISKKQKS